MKISQLSVFLENKVGVVTEVTRLLGESGVDMRAFSVSDGVEFGILRLIVDDVEKARTCLEAEGYKVNLTDVVKINVPNVPGALSALLQCLAREEVFIKYMYAFSEGEVASTIIRPTDVDRCIEVLDDCRLRLSSISPLYSY